jgi:hypothetical protein
MVQQIRAIVPEAEPQVITVIAFNDVVNAGALNEEKVNRLIPLTLYLLGMAFLRHNVVVFEGHPSALAVGCAGADLLIVDGAMAERLQEDWFAVATSAMRRPRVLMFGRNGQIIPVDESTARWARPRAALDRRRWGSVLRPAPPEADLATHSGAQP